MGVRGANEPTHCTVERPHRPGVGLNRPGVGLLEVLMALLLFVVAATFVLDGLSSAMHAVRRAKLEADAADLSVTVLSEIQMGLLEIRNEGPNEFDQEFFPGWTWQMIAEDVAEYPDLPDLKRVQIVIRNNAEEYVHRITQIILYKPAEQTQSAAGAAEDAMEQEPQGLNAPPRRSDTGDGSGTLPGGAP